MKIIYPDNASVIDAGPAETLAEFGVGHLTSEHLAQPWKASAGAGVDSVTIKLRSIGPASAVAVMGMRLDGLLVEVFSDAALTQPVGSKQYSGIEQELFGPSLVDSCWFEFPQQTLAWFQLTVGTSSNENPSIGRVSTGIAVALVNPKWGYGQGIQDYSSVNRARNGAKVGRGKLTARNPKLTLEIPIQQPGARSQYDSLIELYQQVKSVTPFACLAVEGRTNDLGESLDHRYILWASFAQNSFNATEGSYSIHTIDFTLEEHL